MLIKTKGVLISDFPTNMPSVENLFRNAVMKTAPFDKTGNNYRDMVIWLGVKEFCQTHKGKQIFFLTKDGNFNIVVKTEGIANLTHGTYAHIKSKLEEKLTGAQRERQDRLANEIAAIAGEADFLLHIESRVKNDVTFSIADSVTERLLSIENFKMSRMLGIDSLADVTDSALSFRSRYEGTLSISVEVPTLLHEAKLSALRQIASKPSKIGDKRQGQESPFVAAAAVTNAQGGLLGRIQRPPPTFFGNTVEAREWNVLIDVVGVADLNDDQVTQLNILRVSEADLFETEEASED